MKKGQKVMTPQGVGTVNYVRMAPPDFTVPEAVSVFLEKHDSRINYSGTIFKFDDVSPVIGEAVSKLPDKNIHWKKVAEMHKNGLSPDVELVKLEGGNRAYVFCRNGFHDAVVFWGGRSARKAQKFLDRIAFMRCDHDDCGIRVGIEGGSCGNHSPWGL